MAKITIAVRLPYEDLPREIIVDEQDYQPGDWGVAVTKDNLQVIYPWHRVDWIARPVASRA